MNIRGTKKWRGVEPNPVSVKQQVYFIILEELTGKTFTAGNSREAYALIGEYRNQIENNVVVEYFLDTDNPYIFYSDIYIDKQYRFTIESICREPVGYDIRIDIATIKSFKIHENNAFV